MSDLVKGSSREDGRFLLLSPEEIETAYPKTTQTIEIKAFVPIDDIPSPILNNRTTRLTSSGVQRCTPCYAKHGREPEGRRRESRDCQQAASGASHAMRPVLVLNLSHWGARSARGKHCSCRRKASTLQASDQQS